MKNRLFSPSLMRPLLLSLVLWLPMATQMATRAMAAVPTPESHFGHKIGVDNELLDWDKVVSYFQALEKSSDRIKFMEIGKTRRRPPADRGGRFLRPRTSGIWNIIATSRCGSPIRARPRRRSRRALEAEGKTIVMITCSIHATEVASTHTAVEFAYRLLTEDNNPKFKAILDNVIMLLEPSQNPDGVDIVTQLVSQDARDAVRRDFAAGAVSPLRRPRRQSRLVYFHAAGNAQHGRARKPVASGDRLRRAPDGPNTGAHFRSAMDGPGGPQYRSDPGEHLQHDRHRHGDGSCGGRQDRHRHQRDVRFLVARAGSIRPITAARAF